MTARTIRKQYEAVSDDIGDLRTQRPLPNDEIDQVDPFLFLNHHGPQVYPPGNRGLPFGPHPHRGFETVTFIVKGTLAHRDTGGHDNVIREGGVQWMTAGRGVEHSEVSPKEFLKEGGPLEILQLWVNLPSRLKMTEPRYTGLQKNEIPVVKRDGAVVNLIAGTFGESTGPIKSLTDVHMMTVGLKAGGRVTLPAPHDRNVFLYVVREDIRIGTTVVPALHLVDLNNDGDNVVIEARSDSMILFGHAAPIGEPVVSHGPFVMNSREEIMTAIRDYQAGRFRGVTTI